MSKPSPSKSTGKKMKYKYDNYLNMFSESSIKSNVNQIQDTEIGHVEMEEFLKRVREAPSMMTHIIASEVHKYASFPVVAHDLNFVLAVTERFDPIARQIKDADGNVVIHLDSEYFNSIFKGSYVEEVMDITPTRAHKWYEENEDKCKKTINNVFLQTATNSTTSHWPKFFHRSDFTMEYNVIVLKIIVQEILCPYQNFSHFELMTLSVLTLKV